MMRTVYDDCAPHNGSNERLLHNDMGGRVELPHYDETATMKALAPPTKITQVKDVSKRGRSPGRFPESISEALDTPEKPCLRRARSSPLQGYDESKIMKSPGAGYQRQQSHMTLSQRIRATSPGRYPEDDIDTMPNRPGFIGRHRPNQKPKKSILKKDKPAATILSTNRSATPNRIADRPIARGRTMDRDRQIDHHSHHEEPRLIEEMQMRRPGRSRSNSLDPVREQRQYEDEDDSSSSMGDDEDEIVSPNTLSGDGNSSVSTQSSFSDDENSSSSVLMDDELEPPNQPQVQPPLLHEALLQEQTNRREQQELRYILAQQQVYIQQEQLLEDSRSQPVDPEDDIEEERQRELQFQRLLNSISGDDDSDLGCILNNGNYNDYDRRHSYDHDQRHSTIEGEIRPRRLSDSWRTYRIEHRYDEEDEELENERESRFQSVLDGMLHTPSPPTSATSTEFGSIDNMIAHQQHQQPPKQQRRHSMSSSTSSVTSGKKRRSNSAARSSPALRRSSVRAIWRFSSSLFVYALF